MKKSLLDNIIVAVFLFSIAFTALAHGAVEPWSAAIFKLIVLLLMLLWTIKFVVNKSIEITIPVPALPLAAFLLYGIVQSIAFTDRDGRVSSLSYDVEATRGAVQILFFLFVSHLFAANIFNNWERIRTLINFLTIFGFILAVFSLIQHFTWNGKLYWIIPTSANAQGVVGSFINRNHLAGYLELILPLPIALIITGAAKHTRILYAFAAVMMAITIIASLSRGGIIGLSAGLLFISAAGVSYSIRREIYLTNQRDKRTDLSQGSSYKSTFRNVGAVALIIATIVLGTIWIGLDPVVNRLSNNNIVSDDENLQSFENSRGWIWKNSITMFKDNQVLGVGLGAFETSYPKYSDKYGGQGIIDRAHNDYLQILTDTGLIGGVIALCFLLSVLFVIRRGLTSIEPFQAGIVIGCSAAIVSLLVHSIFDFNLQIPSTSLLFLVLTAVLTITSSLKERENLDT